MTMTPATIAPARGAKKSSKRLGRGNASQKGTSAGRGTKGQRARSGGKKRTSLRALRPQIMKVPKLRGWKSIHPKPAVVTLRTLSRIAKDGATVSPASLAAEGVIRTAAHGVKIIGNAPLDKKITVVGCVASKGALAAIEKAGGSVTF